MSAAQSRGPLLWIDWKDHASSDGWIQNSGYQPDEIVCTSIGFLIFEDEEILVLASTVDGQQPESSSGRQQILKNCILNTWELPSR